MIIYSTLLDLRVMDGLLTNTFYLLQAWLAACGVVRFAVRVALSISRVNAVWSSHVGVQWAVAHEGESLKGNHGVLARRHGGGHSGKTQVGGLL